MAAVAAILSLALGACGGEPETQGSNEPEGEFPVEVTVSKFPTEQRLAQTSDLILGVENIGEETLPELAFTIETEGGDLEPGSGSFEIRADDAALADPSRPVWILENKYPRPVGEPPPKGPSSGARAQTNTFGFGPLEPGETEEIIWRVTPVQPGNWTLSYEVAAGLDGNAEAVTRDGGDVEGEFVVTITDKPPKASVNDAGEVVTEP